MRFRSVLVLVLLLNLPLLALAGSEPEVVGPDAEGAYGLAYEVVRSAEGAARLELDVLRTDADETTRGSRALELRPLPAGVSRVAVSFLPAEGPGRYEVTLLVEGRASGTAVFQVEHADGASRQVAFHVPDEPTGLALTSDGVNANGRLKSPGEAVLTRASLRDGNGLGELDGVRVVVARAVGPDDVGVVEEAALPNTWDPDATSASLEHRFERSPLAAGEHRLTLSAIRQGHPVANATRTFVVREVAPVLLSAPVANVTPDLATLQRVEVLLGDRNGLPGPGLLEARLFRGSSRLDGNGYAANLSMDMALGVRLPDADGLGRAAYPLDLALPAGAPAGMYRVSFYANGSLLGSAPFEVRPLPTLARVEAFHEEGALRLVVNGTGEGLLQVRIAGGDGFATETVPFRGHASLLLQPSGDAPRYAWSVNLSARPEGPTLDGRQGEWVRAEGPIFSLVPLREGSRMPLAWRLDAQGWDLAQASLEGGVRRWDGSPADEIRLVLRAGTLRADAPPTLAPGVYEASLHLLFPNGTRARLVWTFEAGPWLRIELGEAVVQGREATLPLRNAGGLPVGRLAVELDPPLAQAKLEHGAVTLAGRVAGGRQVFDGFDLAPGESARLRVVLPEGPLPSGDHRVLVRILALGAGR